MVVGAMHPDSGKILIDGKLLSENSKGVSVCPQFDTVWDDLSVEEHLYFYCKCRGISSARAQVTARNIAKAVGLDGDSFRMNALQLSGGMRRRLSIAIALLGGSNILILDEPTTGLDPSTRRSIWTIIDNIKKDNNKCVVITTHSMEEADALCTKIGILCDGRLEAIGSQAHLKNKFSNGVKLTFMLNVQCEGNTSNPNHLQSMKAAEFEELNKLDSKISDLISENYQREQSSNLHTIPRNQWHIIATYMIALSDKHKVFEIFAKIEQFCEENGIIEWGFSQSSLEDVYLKVVIGSASKK